MHLLILLPILVILYKLIRHLIYKDKLKPRVLVLVLGDLGRSPRMQFHSSSLAENGFIVDFIGYNGSSLPSFITNSSNIYVKRISTPKKLKHTGWKGFYVLKAIQRILIQLLTLMWGLFLLPCPSYILVQNPPAIPSLFLVQCISWIRWTRLVIEWHNFGFSLMALNLGSHHILVQIAKYYEKVMGRFAYVHLCVSVAMKEFLVNEFHIP